MLIAAVTAAAVFAIGRPFIPRPGAPGGGAPKTEVAPPPPPVVPPPTNVAATDAATATEAGAASAAARSADGGGSLAAGSETSADGGPSKGGGERTAAADAAGGREPTHAAEQTKPGETEPTGTEPEDKSAAADAEKPQGPAAVTPADKEIAHAAWRANRPDVRVSGSRSILVVPLKGSVRDGTSKFFPKTRVVAIVLPHAASLNTMHFYRLRRHGFRTLWTFQDESNARASDGTKLRIKLDVSSPPQVELHDDFVRVIIARPETGKETTEAKDDGKDE
jgi:hypothetical protein